MHNSSMAEWKGRFAKLFGREDIRQISYARLAFISLLLLFTPGIVAEISVWRRLPMHEGTGRYLMLSAVVLFTVIYLWANVLVASACTIALQRQRWIFTFSIITAIIALVTFIPGLIFYPDYDWLFVLGGLCILTQSLSSLYVVSCDVFGTIRVSAREVWGGIALYILVAMVYGNLYGVLYVLNPKGFSENLGFSMESWGNFLYYSFVTQTTLGYGDIIPISPLARMVSISQAMFGALYPPVILARLVSQHVFQREEE